MIRRSAVAAAAAPGIGSPPALRGEHGPRKSIPRARHRLHLRQHRPGRSGRRGSSRSATPGATAGRSRCSSTEIAAMLERHPASAIDLVAATGTGGTLAAELLGGVFVNEIVAQSAAVARLVPSARSVIEIGGEDSKLILMVGGRTPRGAAARLADFAMNTICAAGTGSFLDQQAKRLGLVHRGRVRRAGAAIDEPAPHRRALQRLRQERHDPPPADRHARCTTSWRGSASPWPATSAATSPGAATLEAPVVFQGGVAANAGVVRALREVFGLADGELMVPEHHASMGAIGAVFHARGLAAAGGRGRRLRRPRPARGPPRERAGARPDGHLEPLRPPRLRAAEGRRRAAGGRTAGSRSPSASTSDRSAPTWC